MAEQAERTLNGHLNQAGCLKRYGVLSALLLVNIITLTYFSVDFLDICKFTFSVLIFTWIPGLLLLDYLGIYPHSLYRFALALAVGVCLDIILYLIASIFAIKLALYFVFAFFLSVYFWKKRMIQDLRMIACSIRTMERYLFAWLSILGFLIPVLIAFWYFYPNILPGTGEAVIYSIDYPWHIGNIAEIKNHWFPNDPRLAGYSFHYHVFLYVYLAMISYLSKIAVPVLFFRLYMVFFIYLIFLGAYFSARRWYGKPAVGIINIIIFLFLGTGLCSFPGNLFLKDLFMSPTFLLAVTLTLFLLLEIKEYITGGHRNTIWTVMLLACGVSGAKGSFFPVIFSGILLCFVYGWWKGKPSLRVNILTGTSLLVFMAVFVYIFSGPGSEGFQFVPLEIIRKTDLFKNYLFYLNQNETRFNMLCFIPVYFVAFFSFRVLGFIGLSHSVLSSWRNIPPEKLFILGIITASFIPAYLLNYRGSSQYFFLFAGYMALNIISAQYIYYFFKQKRSTILVVIFIILIAGSAGDTLVTMRNYYDSTTRLLSFGNKPLTPDVYEGMAFIRDNTKKDAVVGSYRSFWLSEENPRFFYYSAFTERRILVEGWEYMSPAYREEAFKRHEDMKTLFSTREVRTAKGIIEQYGIDYLIVYKHRGQRLRFKVEGVLQQAFQNSEMVIYKVL